VKTASQIRVGRSLTNFWKLSERKLLEKSI
jgi:hypothetical protein